MSSSGHGNSPVVFDDLFFQRPPYDPAVAYGQSTTANVLFAVEASRRWAADGITANAVMPGGIFTNLQRHGDPDVLADTIPRYGDQAKTPEQGACSGAPQRATNALTERRSPRSSCSTPPPISAASWAHSRGSRGHSAPAPASAWAASAPSPDDAPLTMIV